MKKKITKPKFPPDRPIKVHNKLRIKKFIVALIAAVILFSWLYYCFVTGINVDN